MNMDMQWIKYSRELMIRHESILVKTFEMLSLKCVLLLSTIISMTVILLLFHVLAHTIMYRYMSDNSIASPDAWGQLHRQREIYMLVLFFSVLLSFLVFLIIPFSNQHFTLTLRTFSRILNYVASTYTNRRSPR